LGTAAVPVIAAAGIIVLLLKVPVKMGPTAVPEMLLVVTGAAADKVPVAGPAVVPLIDA
jgi:hypothetical protein